MLGMQHAGVGLTSDLVSRCMSWLKLRAGADDKTRCRRWAQATGAAGAREAPLSSDSDALSLGSGSPPKYPKETVYLKILNRAHIAVIRSSQLHGMMELVKLPQLFFCTSAMRSQCQSWQTAVFRGPDLMSSRGGCSCPEISLC